jgi:pimeloyl-ACP methyl ester carboxylesterase
MRIGLDATAGIVSVVEHMHGTIQRRPSPFDGARAGRASGVAGFVYRTLQEGIGWTGRGLDWPLAAMHANLPDGAQEPAREAVLAALNGVYGDYLQRTRNPLAIEMSLRHRSGPVETIDVLDLVRSGSAPRADKLIVLVHGLCMNDRQWTREGHDHGASLAAEFGRLPLYLRYNSGLRIAENGERFAEELERLVADWPLPVRDITIIGHSMGGLIARSACFFAGRRDHAWLKRLRRMVFLGTPHLGAPLERGGRWLDMILDASPYSAPIARLGKARSAGIQDLGRGAIAPEGERDVPLPADVECYAVAATLADRTSPIVDRLLGDGLVPLDSALGGRKDGSLGIPSRRQWIACNTSHLGLLSSPDVHDRLRAWIGSGT